MKKYLPKAQKGKIIKGVAQAAKKVKVPKPKLPTRTITKGRKKFYDTDAYAKEGLKQAMTKRNVISSGDVNKVKKLLKNPNITNQDALDMFRAAIENNPTMKLYQRGGFTPPPSGVISSEERRRRREEQLEKIRQAERSGISIDEYMRKKRLTDTYRNNEGIPKKEDRFNPFKRRKPVSPIRNSNGVIRRSDRFPFDKMSMGGNVYSAKQFRRSKKY